MAIRINRGRPSLKNIKAKYRKKYGADWFNKKTAMAAYRREVAGKKHPSRRHEPLLLQRRAARV